MEYSWLHLRVFKGDAEICVLLGRYAVSSGNSLPTVRDNLTVPSSGTKNHFCFLYFLDSWALKMRSIGCPETSVKKYHYTLCNNSEERSFHLFLCGSLISRKANQSLYSPGHALMVAWSWGCCNLWTVGTRRWQGCQPNAPPIFTRQEILPVLISVRG